MGFWSKLIAVILGLLLVSGVALSWQFLRFGSVAEMGGPLLALLAGASIVPAVGLLVWGGERAQGRWEPTCFSSSPRSPEPPVLQWVG